VDKVLDVLQMTLEGDLRAAAYTRLLEADCKALFKASLFNL
jgi:hypothetical protein